MHHVLLLPPIQIPHPAPCDVPIHPHPTQQTMRQTLSQELATNQKISQSQITIKQLIVAHQVSLTPTQPQHQWIKPKRKSQEHDQNINKVKAKLSQSQLFKRIR